MCLPDFIEMKQIDINKPIIGYRTWRNLIKDSLILKSEYQEYNWSKIEDSHKVEKENSGIYAYNNNNNNYDYDYNNNNNYDYNNNNYDYDYNNNYYYYISGIILQYGNTAVHKTGQRSEYARIKTLFTIRESDAIGPKEFLGWIKIFNKRIEDIAKEYDCNTIHYQDFLESENKK